MQRSILAVSPNLQFLEQIRSHLEEGGRYRVQGVTSGSDALALVSTNYYDLAILDAESSDVPFVPFTRDLVGIQPGLKLLVFPPQNNPHHPVLTGLVANGFLNKPFFTPEVSRALKNIFQEVVDEPEIVPEPTNDLAKLWIQRPEMGINRVEQLLGSTTAHTGLLVSQGKVIAGSGPSDDATIQTALNLLANHNINKESMELMRFVPLENEGGELLMYASQLINGITLVLFYPSTSSIQLVRQEVYQVKDEFKQAYPTTGELRRDLEDAPSTPSDEIPETKMEIADSTTESEPGDEELIPLEDEIGSDELDSILSQIELKNLDAMLADMPAPDPDLEKPVVEEQLDEEPTIAMTDSEISTWVPFADIQEENAGVDPFPQASAEENIIAETTPDFLKETSATVPPPLPTEFMDVDARGEPYNPVVLETEAAAATETEPNDDWISEEERVENIEKTAEVSPVVDDFDFNLPWETVEAQAEGAISEKSIEETQAVEGAINETEVDFSAWVENAPASDIHKEPVERTSTTPPAEEPLSVEEVAPEMDFSFEPSAAEDEIANLIDEVDFTQEPQELEPEIESISGVIAAEYETASGEESQEVISSTMHVEGEDQIQEKPTGDAGAVPDQPPPLPQESYNTNLSTEPGTSPLGVRNFRFNYTCLLIPRDPKQFLTRDLSERLSFLLPQLHLEYGLRLTGITIRPQYMLWSVSLPIDVCPIHTVRDIRRRTTAHITSNFTDLTPLGNGDDFWAPGFLILSGHASPAVGMIYDFISQTRASQSLND